MQVIDPSVDSGKCFALGYGGSGTGKTHLAGTLGDIGYTLIIDADKGYKTLVKPNVPGITQKMRDNLVICSVEQFRDLDTAYQLIVDNDPDRWSRVLSGKNRQVTISKPFDWVVWDTWSEMQWTMLQELRKKEGLLSGNMGKTIEFRKNIGIQHWGMLTDLNKLAIEQLRDCTYSGGVNQLFLMQEKIDKNDDLGTLEKGPAIHGKMMGEMPTYFDIVFHTSTDAVGNFMATTKRKAGWPAKTRLGEGQEYKNPTAKEVLGL